MIWICDFTVMTLASSRLSRGYIEVSAEKLWPLLTKSYESIRQPTLAPHRFTSFGNHFPCFGLRLSPQNQMLWPRVQAFGTCAARGSMMAHWEFSHVLEPFCSDPLTFPLSFPLLFLQAYELHQGLFMFHGIAAGLDQWIWPCTRGCKLCGFEVWVCLHVSAAPLGVSQMWPDLLWSMVCLRKHVAISSEEHLVMRMRNGRVQKIQGKLYDPSYVQCLLSHFRKLPKPPLFATCHSKRARFVVGSWSSKSAWLMSAGFHKAKAQTCHPFIVYWSKDIEGN